MHSLVLHPVTERFVDQYAQLPAHALLIVGRAGSGKFALTKLLASKGLNLDPEVDIVQHPAIKFLHPEGVHISIDAIRELQQFTKLKVVSSATYNRVIVIDQADLLSTEAQNALLKLLEEPPAGTYFLLSSTNEQALLPTIRSRTQIFHPVLPSLDTLKKHFSTPPHTEDAVNRALTLSGGLPGLMYALLQEDHEHPLVAAAAEARNLVGADQFTRLTMVDGLAKRKTETLYTLGMLQHMAHVALQQQASKQAPLASLKRWQQIMQAAYKAENALRTSAQAKLALTNLMLTM